MILLSTLRGGSVRSVRPSVRPSVPVRPRPCAYDHIRRTVHGCAHHVTRDGSARGEQRYESEAASSGSSSGDDDDVMLIGVTQRQHGTTARHDGMRSTSSREHSRQTREAVKEAARFGLPAWRVARRRKNSAGLGRGERRGAGGPMDEVPGPSRGRRGVAGGAAHTGSTGMAAPVEAACRGTSRSGAW